MRLNTRKNNTETHGELSSAHFGISAKDQVKIVTILRDALYSDKILAVLREYGANAWDAQAEAGRADQPFKVVLPSRFNPILKIRDYGTGIPESDIYDVYTKYGSSTKDDSNTAVGMFGIGCKSGFAYCDAFTVVSYHQGVKSTYSAVVDDTQLGQMTKLAEEPTDETGIEIQIPVRMQDVTQFIDKAKNLFKHFVPQPEINTVLHKKDYTLSGTNWAFRANDGEGPYAIMGNIGYPIDIGVVGPFLGEQYSEFLKSSIDFVFPIGALEVAASREHLQYRDRTLNAIKAAILIAKNELSKEIEKKFESANTKFEKRLVYQDLIREGQWVTDKTTGRRYTNISHTLARDFRNKFGFDLAKNRIHYLRSSEFLEVKGLRPGESTSVGITTSHFTNYSVLINKQTVIVLNDVTGPWVSRAITLRQQLQNRSCGFAQHMMVIKFKTTDLKAAATAYKKWIADMGLEGAPVYKLSDYEPAKLPPKAAKRNNNAKTKNKVFYLKADSYQQFVRAPSDNWEVASVDLKNDSGVWVEISSFRPVSKKINLSTILSVAKSVGVDLSTLKIVGVKPKEKSKMGDKWTPVDEWYEDLIKQWLADVQNNAVRLLNIQSAMNHAHPNHQLAYVGRAESLVKAGLPPDHPVVKYFTEIADYLTEASNWSEGDIAKMKILITAIQRMPDDKKPSASYNISDKQQQLNKAYPMLYNTHIFSVGIYGADVATKRQGYLNAKHAKRYANYIKLVDTN